jgi:hypothetical protein
VAAAQWQQHSGSSTVAATQWQQHGGNNTVAAAQWQQHSGSNTVAAAKWQQHSGSSTVAATQWQQHSSSNTVAVVQLVHTVPTFIKTNELLCYPEDGSGKSVRSVSNICSHFYKNHKPPEFSQE